MLTINITFPELKAIANNQDKEENKLIWRVEGVGDYDLFVLYELIEDDEFYDIDDESEELILTAVGLSDDGKDAFIRGFCDNSPYWYTDDSGEPFDKKSPLPWCAPWLKDNSLDWFAPEIYTAYEMGKHYAAQVRPEMHEAHDMTREE